MSLVFLTLGLRFNPEVNLLPGLLSVVPEINTFNRCVVKLTHTIYVFLLH